MYTERIISYDRVTIVFLRVTHNIQDHTSYDRVTVQYLRSLTIHNLKLLETCSYLIEL